jgi:hypothetical protein
MAKTNGPKDPKWTAAPSDLREDPDWFDAIGPENEDPEIVADHLNDYGFNQMDEDDFESDPVGPADSPDWTENAVYGEDRPLIPEDEERDVPPHLEREDIQLTEEETSAQ